MEISRKGIDLQTLRSQLRPDDPENTTVEDIVDIDEEIQSRSRLSFWSEQAAILSNKPSSEEVFNDVYTTLLEGGPQEQGFAHFLKFNQSVYQSYIEGLGYPSEETAKEWDEDKERIKSAVGSLDISKIGDDPRIFSGRESEFADAVKDYLEKEGFLHGEWLKTWNAEFVKGQIARTTGTESGDSFFGGLDSILNQKFKEAESTKSQEGKIETVLDDVDEFLTDDYLGRHKNLEKKLQDSSLSPEGLMNYIFKTQKVPDEAFGYLRSKMPDKFQDFAENLQEKYDQRLEAKQKEFDVLFDQVFGGVSIDQYDPNEIADLKQMIYTSAKNSRSINELNDWYEDDKDRFIKYRKCVDMRVQDEKEMWEDIQEIGDFQLGYEHDELRKRYQQDRKQWSGGTYYSPGDQWMYVKDMKAKVKMRRRQMERENMSMQSSLEGKFEGGAFDWGDNEKLGKRMQSYLGGMLEKAPTLAEREKVLRNLESRFPTLQSQLQAMHGLWEGMEKEVGKDNVDPKFLGERDKLWKSMLGQIMPKDKSSFAPDRWNISDQLSGLRKLVGEIRADRVKTLDEEQKQKDVEDKIKKGDISELPVDDDRLAKSDKFNETLLKSWGYTKSQFGAAVGNDKAQLTLKKLHTQWQEAHEKHWEGVVSEQTSRLNRKVDALPGKYDAVGKFFIEGMKKQAGPDKPTKKRHEWMLKNEPAILDTVNAMDRYVREYDALMTSEFGAFVHQERPQLGQKLNTIWSELTGKVANGEFGKLGSSLGGYDGKTKSLYDQSQKEYQKYLQEQEVQAQTEKEEAEQEAADKKLEASFKAGQSSLDTRFSFFLRRHQAMASQQGGATGSATTFKDEADLKKAVLGGMTGLDAYADKEYFDEWIAKKFKGTKEGDLDGEDDIFATIKSLDKRTEVTRKAFEDAGYPIDDMRQLELLDKYNIRPDYLGRTGLNINQLTKGLERLERLSSESGKVGYIDQMMKENSLNSTGAFGTMVVGMLSVMNPNDFDTWKSDLRKMDFKMGKPGKEDAVLLMNSLFTNDRLMSQVNKDLSDLRSRFVSEGLKTMNIDLKDIMKDDEAATLEAILEELEKQEKAEREPDTPVEEVEGYFELNGAEVSEQEAVMAQLAGYRFDPAVSSRGLSAQHLDQGLERIVLLEQVQVFSSLDKVLREGTQNGYLSNHLFESLAIISDAEFKQWETQVRGMNLEGMNDEEKAYAMLQLLFDQGTLDRIAQLEGAEEESVEEDLEMVEEGMEEVSAEEGELPVDGEEVGVGHTIDLEGEDDGAQTTQGDDSVMTDEPEGDLEVEVEESLEDEEMADEAIDEQADEGDALLEGEEEPSDIEDLEDEEITDEEIDEQANEGEELLEQEFEIEEDAEESEEALEEALVGMGEESMVEGVEGGEDLGARSVSEGGEFDGGGDDEEDGIDLVKEGDENEKLETDVFDDEAMEEQPYATADDFSDDEEEESSDAEAMEDEEDETKELTDEELDVLANEGERDLEDEEDEDAQVEALSQDEIDALVGEGEALLDGEGAEELQQQELIEDEIDALADEEDEEEETETDVLEGEEPLEQIEVEEAEEEELQAQEEEQELEEQEELERIEAEAQEVEEQEIQEQLEAEEEESERLEAEEEQELEEQEAQEELERIEAEEQEVEEQEIQEQLEAEEEERLEAEEQEAEDEEELERLEAEEAEQETLEAQEAERAEIEESELLDKEIALEEQTELVAEIKSWTESEGWQLGVQGLTQATDKLGKGDVLEDKEKEALENAFDQAQEGLDQQRAEVETEQESLKEQEALEAEEALQAQEEEQALAEQQETEKQAEVERMLAEFIELMVGEKEKAEMDREKEASEKEERKEQVMELIADSARTDRGMEGGGGGLDLDGVLDIFREDVADFGQSRLVKKIYNSKDVMQKARGMMEYFLSQDMYKQLLKLNMRSTSMLSEDGWHFFAELYGDVYVTRIMTMQEILRRFYHYVSLLEEGDVDLQISVSKALLEADIENAESVYRQLIGFYHSHKKRSGLTALKFENEGSILRSQMQFGTLSHVTTITVSL